MAVNIDQTIKNLVGYGLNTGLITDDDEVYTVNLILDCLKRDSYEAPEGVTCTDLEEILKEILDYAWENKLMDDNGPVSRDLFDTRVMNCLVPRPSEVRAKFRKLYAEDPGKATDWFYKFSQDTDYIRRYRIKKDLKWKTDTEYGPLDITINLSKPEKDPKAIAAAKNAPQTAYPKCQLCAENEGYAGRLNHPARENHRIIPITIANQEFYMQYSPYVYYNEHCIVFNKQHTPMKIDRSAFEKLFDFIRLFPHYTIGSNADLPIVGGSILSHDHFQGGHYEFPMARAEYTRTFTVEGFEDIEAGVIKWPLSVIRLRGTDPERVITLSERILTKWRVYTDESAYIFAETDGEPHNTITPIVRMRDGKYEIDLTLRNNITTPECPLGLYHPHNELHHIKKENIGLIEVMGLAVLPSRLRGEMDELKKAILDGKDIRSIDSIAKHADWVDGFSKNYGEITEANIDEILQNEIGKVFCRVLEDAGVYKQTPESQEALKRFTDSI
ncbi:MAG: UDP-glucose--hexose-1-phosphate uridylyltransferase [Lachnospiraceae bacterium]|nr:UDP-glucose--hexose-1-phosphate uridylyltransferase [Lachnospiraceae bacterium]